MSLAAVRRSRIAVLGLAAGLAWAGVLAGELAAATHLVTGSDRATMLVPSGVQVDSYSNAGYRLVVEDSVAEVEVDLAPLDSRQGFDERLLPPAQTAEARLARAVAAGARTRFEAVSRILGWITANVRYELDRALAQDSGAVLARRSAYCTGTARLAVALLDSLAIPAREIAGYVVEEAPGGPGSGFHRWIEVFYDDRGWVFSDPLASQNFVAATYLRLASSVVESELPGSALLLSRDNGISEIDLLAQTPARLVLARANVSARRTAALRVIAPGFSGAEAELIGPGKRRRVERVRDGKALFLGLTPATYEVQIRERGRVEATRQITIHGPVLADLEIAAFTGSGRGGRGR
ncbi:MAG: transglutaminase-like domain-containing protein [Thermoanaerobaculia bacterium]